MRRVVAIGFLAVALTLAAAPAAPAASADYQAVLADYQADADVAACRFTRQQLRTPGPRSPRTCSSTHRASPRRSMPRSSATTPVAAPRRGGQAGHDAGPAGRLRPPGRQPDQGPGHRPDTQGRRDHLADDPRLQRHGHRPGHVRRPPPGRQARPPEVQLPVRHDPVLPGQGPAQAPAPPQPPPAGPRPEPVQRHEQASRRQRAVAAEARTALIPLTLDGIRVFL